VIKKIVVGTRGSQLAMIQTEFVIGLLKAVVPGLDISLRKITTSGDRDRQSRFEQMGVAVFVKELEDALLDGRINLAVHSLKDVPTEIPAGLALLATPRREDPRDVLVSKARLEDLPAGSRIGTGSLRRSVQIAVLRPDLEICGLRGNMDTRVGKVGSGELEGVITAAAALSRLEWKDRIAQYLPVETFLPAVGQGAIAVEGRSDEAELVQLLSKINHLASWQAVNAERAFLLETGGGCRAPIAALGTIKEGRLRLKGMVASPASRKMIRDSIEGAVESAEELGVTLARKILSSGADKFIAEVTGK
jgi:hydroxymethylbilane synthase